MKKVIIASTNAAKIRVAEKVFSLVYPNEKFEFIPVKSESGVPDQPMEGETRVGARNRLAFIKEKHPDADFWISQEGGLFLDGERLSNRAWIAISDRSGFTAESSTSNFYLPKEISKQVRDGKELGHAVDSFFSIENSKESSGFMGNLTDELIDRTEYYLQPAIIALSEIKHKSWYL